MHSWTYRPFVVEGTATPACTAVTFIYTQSAAAPPPATEAPSCDAVDADNLVEQARNQFNAGFSNAALQLMTWALNCKQSVTWYRLAAIYACAAHDAAAARTYAAKLSPEFLPAVEQKCQSEGIALAHGR